jgi:hypothetical protein
MALVRDTTVMRDDALSCDALARALAALGAFGGATTGVALSSLWHGLRFTPRRLARALLLGAAGGAAAMALQTYLFEPNCSRANRRHRNEPVGAVQRLVDRVLT